MISVAILAVLLTLGVMVAWHGYSRSGGAGSQRVVAVGLYENAPKVYTAENGRPAGLFVELLNEIARIEHWQLRYVPCRWSDCLDRLEQGQLDLLPDVAFSAERDQRFPQSAISVSTFTRYRWPAAGRRSTAARGSR
ncbi:transporter substrate-binding domain-containing protein [Methylocaldum marinum]|uniref:transporter substrate-binding domain-containing protein n=1 Tax=Methylocaldum marinum TaxID=1432792 RepID=UPI001E43551A|nr:transporter substrate-binding domain-containing protein [Methylocaldum marinum]